MKNKYFTALFVLITISLQAQGRRKNQASIHAQYGFTNNGSMIKAGYGKVFGDQGFLGKSEVFYQNYKVAYIDNQSLPYEKYGAGVSAGYSFERFSPFFINAWLGLYGGYEKINEGKEYDSKYHAPIPSKVKGMIYGVSGALEVEYNINRRFSIIADYSQFFDLKSEFSKSKFGIFGGLKYNLN